MKQHLLRIPGLAILALFIQTSGIAQQDSSLDRDEYSPRREDEIVIRHKGGKDAKVTIEIKDGDVLVNGKPVSEFEDSSLSIHRRKVTRNGRSFSYGYVTPDMDPFPGDVNMFPNESNRSGGWSFNGNNVFRGNRAMLGVSTENKAGISGAKVTQVSKGSTAEKMGLKPGDIITRIDDHDISDPSTLFNVIGDHQPGDKVTVTFMRDGKEQKQTAELGKAKGSMTEPFNLYNFEMPDMKDLPQGTWPKEFRTYLGNSLKFGIRAQDSEDGKGVKVLEVDDESTAAKAGIKEGDIMTRFDGKEINSVSTLTEAAHEAKEKVSVKVSIVRDGKTQEIEVKVPKRLRTADL